MNTLLMLLSGKKTYLTCITVGVLLFGVWQNWWKVPTEVYALLFTAALAFMRAGISKVTPVTIPSTDVNPSEPIAVPIKQVVPLLIVTAVLIGAIGCAHLQPGADPIVVNIERTETLAKSTFDTILGIDNSNRDFFRTNAPGLHNVCEWLRESQTVEETNTLPRATALLVSLDDVKLAYKAGRASSNEVFTVLSTVKSAASQADAWLTVTTNKPATR